MEQPILRFYKNIKKTQNKVVVPIECVRQFGTEYYLEVYKDHIKLVPIKKGE